MAHAEYKRKSSQRHRMPLASYMFTTFFLIQGVEPSLFAPQSPLVPAVVFVGDSFIDVGVNTYLHTIVRCDFPPYGRDFVSDIQSGPTGRFCNGRILPDFVAEKLGLPFPPPYNSPLATGSTVLRGVNVASSGSGWLNVTSELLNIVSGWRQIELVKQWQQRLEFLVDSETAETIKQEALYFIALGSNDIILTYYNNPIFLERYEEPEFRKLLIEAAITTIQFLYNSGARRIAVTGLPALGCLPAVITEVGLSRGKNGSGCLDFVQSLTQKFNDEFGIAIRNLGDILPESKFFIPDLFGISNNLVKSPSTYGFNQQNTRMACCGTGLLEAGPLCNPTTPTCSNPEEYVFWDGPHFTERAYEIIVDSFMNSLVTSIID